MVSLCQTAMDDQIADWVLPHVGTRLSPQEAFRLAIQMGWRGIGQAAPNPMVGAVLVDKGHGFLAAAYHERFGRAHAEAAVLDVVRRTGLEKKLEGAILYVTLEPCAHEGKTPACAKMMASLPLSKIVYGLKDPNPLVSGRGIEILEQAGITCELVPGFEKDTEELCEAFLWNHRKGQVFVGVKAAMGLEGGIATRGDQKVWISSERARQYGHFLRLRYDAIAVGSNTLALDNPELSARHPKLANRDPIKVIFDPLLSGLDRLGGIDQCRLLQSEPSCSIWVVDSIKAQQTHLKALEKIRAKIIHASINHKSWVDLSEVLSSLFKHDVGSLLVEGGAGLYSRFFADGLVNRVHFFQSAKFASLSDRIFWYENFEQNVTFCLSDVKITAFNEDWLVEGKVVNQEARGF